MSRAATKALINAAMDAFAAHGQPIFGARIHPDGSITLLTEPTADALPSNDTSGDWVDLAGEKTVRSAQRA